MAYCTRAQIESAIGEDLVVQVCDDESAGASNPLIDGRVTAAIAQAGQDVDGYLQAHFSVPLTGTIPPLVQSITLDVAAYYLLRRRRATFGMPEDVASAYERRLKQLEAINKGALHPGIEPTPTASSYEVATTEGPAQVFTASTYVAGGADRGTLKDF